MRYDAVQVDYLAAEYVLGTLRGPARRRFARLIADRADIRFAVWRWERHLNDLPSGLTPHRPRRRVWKNIQRRIELSQTRPGMLQTDAITVPELAADSSYELWVLPVEGPPQSLGLLPVSAGSVATRISPQLIAALTDAGRLAISLEPIGGSPTGQPTGPVVYVTSLVSL